MHSFFIPILVILHACTSQARILEIIDYDRQCLMWSNDNSGCTGYSELFGLLDGNDCSSRHPQLKFITHTKTRPSSNSMLGHFWPSEMAISLTWFWASLMFFMANPETAGLRTVLVRFTRMPSDFTSLWTWITIGITVTHYATSPALGSVPHGWPLNFAAQVVEIMQAQLDLLSSPNLDWLTRFPWNWSGQMRPTARPHAWNKLGLHIQDNFPKLSSAGIKNCWGWGGIWNITRIFGNREVGYNRSMGWPLPEETKLYASCACTSLKPRNDDGMEFKKLQTARLRRLWLRAQQQTSRCIGIFLKTWIIILTSISPMQVLQILPQLNSPAYM